MMRLIAFAFCLALLAAAGVSVVVTHGETWPLTIVPAILVAGLLCERYLYKPIRSDVPGAGWERTAERFVDPGSGRTVVVFHNPRTGERRYVADGP